MTLANTTQCPQVQIYVARETARLTESVQRVFRGLDSTAAAKALKDAIVSDVTDNATKIAKATAEGLGSEFTQNLLKGVIDQVLGEISTNFPETRDVIGAIKSFSDISFSLIQTVLVLAEKSPLTMATRAKRNLQDRISQRNTEIDNLEGLLTQLRDLIREVVKRKPIGTTVSTTFQSASDKLAAADSDLTKVRAGLVKKVLETTSLSSAIVNLEAAMKALSPLEEQMSRTAVTTNAEIIELLQSGFGDSEINKAILASNGLHSFDYEESSITALTEAGMSDNVKRVFLSVKNAKAPQDPDTILFNKIKSKLAEINTSIDKIGAYNVAIPRLLSVYISIKEHLETPKPQETNAQSFYLKIVDSSKARIQKLIGLIGASKAVVDFKKRPTKEEQESTQIDAWIAEIVAIISILELVQQGFYNEKRLNANPVNTQFYNAYEKSLEYLNRDKRIVTSTTFRWTNATQATERLGFDTGLKRAQEVSAYGRSILNAKSKSDLDNLLARINATLLLLKNEQKNLAAYEIDVQSCLNQYSPEPEIPRIFELLDNFISQAGFDRLADKLLEGDIGDVLNCTPEVASYAGAAAKCLRDLAEQATNEFERAKFEKEAVNISRKERSRLLGNVNISMRSATALTSLQRRLLDIGNLMKNLFDQALSNFNEDSLAGPGSINC